MKLQRKLGKLWIKCFLPGKSPFEKFVFECTAFAKDV